MKQCCILLEDDTRCEKLGVCSIEWPDGNGLTIAWYCAEHYDFMVARLKESGRIALLRGSGVR